MPIKRALFARCESSRDVKMGENARTRSLSPRAPVLPYSFCFDSSDAREYVCLFFCQVGWKKEKKKLAAFDEKRVSLETKTQSKFVLARGGRKKNEDSQKVNFYSLLLVFFGVSLTRRKLLFFLLFPLDSLRALALLHKSSVVSPKHTQNF